MWDAKVVNYYKNKGNKIDCKAFNTVSKPALYKIYIIDCLLTLLQMIISFYEDTNDYIQLEGSTLVNFKVKNCV